MKLKKLFLSNSRKSIGDFLWRGFQSSLLLIILVAQLWLNSKYVQINDMNTYKKETDERFKALENLSSKVTELLAVSQYRISVTEKRTEKLEDKVFLK